MLEHFSLVLLLASAWTTRLPVQGAVLAQELSISTCRYMGVALVGKKTHQQMNFTEARETCQVLGLTLASKAQMEAAQKSGFETCSYGWVGDRISVIPRIFPNPKCGKNGVGVLIWNASPSQRFRAYCHNASDTWVNSCIPETVPTFDSMFDTQTPTVEFPVSSSSSSSTDSASSPDSTTHVPATTRAPPSTSMVRKTKKICMTEVYTEPNTVAAETEPPVIRETTFKNEAVGFGGVPTTLLVLALLFFGAAAVLAVCYVKRYVKAFPFTNKSPKKEMIETKVVKEEKADDINSNEESKKTDKIPEEPKSPPRTAVRCLEAEV